MGYGRPLWAPGSSLVWCPKSDKTIWAARPTMYEFFYSRGSGGLDPQTHKKVDRNRWFWPSNPHEMSTDLINFRPQIRKFNHKVPGPAQSKTNRKKTETVSTLEWKIGHHLSLPRLGRVDSRSSQNWYGVVVLINLFRRRHLWTIPTSHDHVSDFGRSVLRREHSASSVHPDSHPINLLQFRVWESKGNVFS